MKFWQRFEAVSILVASFVVAGLVLRYREPIEAYLAAVGPHISIPIAIFVFALVASAPFSATDALAIMNGIIFGPVVGSLIDAAGIVLAAIVGYLIAMRTSSLLNLREQIEKLPSWARRFKVGSPMFLLTVRIIPGLGGTVATQTAAAMRVPLIVHIWTMSAVAIPICSLLTIFGDQVGAFVDTHIAQPVHTMVEKHRPHFRRRDVTPTPFPTETIVR